MTYKSKLIGKENIAEGTMSFTFERPKGFDFKAGQFLEINLANSTKAFSITNPPSLNELTVAMRMGNSLFKNALKDLGIGTEVEIAGPFGSFRLKNKVHPAVFLIGGIGATPVRSIVLDATEHKLQHEIYLFYSNRRPEDAAFLDDLNVAAIENKKFHFIPTMTELERSKLEWYGETGYITSTQIKKYLPKNLSEHLFYISGPNHMVKAMRKIVADLGVDEDNIMTEEFSGY